MPYQQGVFTFDSESILPQDRDAFFRDGMEDMLGKYDVNPIGETPVRTIIKSHNFAPVGFKVIASSPAYIKRQATTSGEPIIGFNFSTGGGLGKIVQRKRTAEYQNGTAGVTLLYEPCETLDQASPRSEMALRVADVDETGGMIFSLDDPRIRLFRAYVSYLKDTTLSGPLDEATAQLARSHVYDLAALVMGSTRDGLNMAQKGGIAAARLIEIKRYIDLNLTNPALCITSVSQDFKLSERYIRLLFSEENGFHQYLQCKRLEQAYKMLTNPAMANLKVIDIAYRCGFNSLATFNRVFFKFFGYTPSSVRP
jgi:AraC-like DNA-binding protein